MSTSKRRTNSLANSPQSNTTFLPPTNLRENASSVGSPVLPSSPLSPLTSGNVVASNDNDGELRRVGSIPQTLIQFLLNSSPSSYLESSGSNNPDELINSTFYVGDVHAFQSNMNNNNTNTTNGTTCYHENSSSSSPNTGNGRRRASSSAASSPRIRSKSTTNSTNNNEANSPSRFTHHHSLSSGEESNHHHQVNNPNIIVDNQPTPSNNTNGSNNNSNNSNNNNQTATTTEGKQLYREAASMNLLQVGKASSTAKQSSTSTSLHYLQPLPEQFRISEDDLPSLSLPTFLPTVSNNSTNLNRALSPNSITSTTTMDACYSTPTPTSADSKTPRTFSGRSTTSDHSNSSNSFSEGLPQTKNNVINFFREKSFQITNIGHGSSNGKAKKMTAINQHSSIGWWEKFDLMPFIFSFISRSEQRCSLRWVCKRWATILIDADYDTCIIGVEGDEVNAHVTSRERRSTIMVNLPNSQKKASSLQVNNTLSQVALIHHFVARDFSGEEASSGILYKFCSLMHSRIVRQDLMNQLANSSEDEKLFALNEREKQEWESQIKINIWAQDHWKIMNDLRKKRSNSLTPRGSVASSEKANSTKKKLGALFNTKTPNASPDTSSITSPNADDILSESPLFFSAIAITESPSEIFKRTLQERHDTYCNLYLQFFYMVSQQPLVYNELCKLCNASLNLQKDNKQKNYNDINTPEGVYESMISNIAASKITPEMLLYKLFERVFTLDTENHEKLWMRCFPNIEKSFIRAQVQNNPEVRHDFFKQYLFEVEVLLDVLFIWIKDFGFKRYSTLDFYRTNGALCEVHMIELVEAFASYALCHCSFSNGDNVIHKKCIKLFKLIDMTKDSLDFECSSMMNDLILSRSIQPSNTTSSQLPTPENNPFVSATLESKSIFISQSENSPPLCTVEDFVFHQFILMDYLFRHVSLFESRTLVYKSSSPQNYDPSQTRFMVLKKLCNIFNNLSNYLLVSCLSEPSLEKRSQILEKIEQIKALSFSVNDFSTTMICTSTINSSALGSNKFTLARCQELLGKELHSMVTTISEKCTVKGLRQEAIAKESELLVPFLGALLTDISFISESHNDFVSSKYGVIFNCHKYQLMTQTMKRLHSRRLKKPSICTPLIAQVPEKTRKLILKRKLGDKILAKLKLIPQQQNPSPQDESAMIRINVQLLEFLAYLLFDWKQMEDKPLYDLALRNEPRKATKDQIKP
ncbi:rasGEF domain-containing protein [Naegleria gruberi]|uniref:RasGEF domain-containing protein n=1 Tax=Naegleria gruberi TaxID=5762 RepID=D2VCE4_NAEGR|nr:rasGEF domain-containing protein [Naegleria gruberi]EFC45406.1 rasGEF domain-containing protein [Naegleria gruberi]|eukprot:XP_002678150.1 rasGEF domain-containing protein [Naegleria gruberi strain NEG-M]